MAFTVEIDLINFKTNSAKVTMYQDGIVVREDWITNLDIEFSVPEKWQDAVESSMSIRLLKTKGDLQKSIAKKQLDVTDIDDSISRGSVVFTRDKKRLRKE